MLAAAHRIWESAVHNFVETNATSDDDEHSDYGVGGAGGAGGHYISLYFQDIARSGGAHIR